MNDLTTYLYALAKESDPNRTWKIDNVRSAIDCLGLKKPSRKVITIVGSNGKGSCAWMLSHCLQQAGFSVGLITSPHVHSYKERCLINSEQLSQEKWERAFVKLQSIPFRELSYYECLMVLSCILVKESSVDFLIAEVGLGGRLDSVNALEPDCVVMSSIDLEHTDRLGDTREKIFKEKIQVARQGIPVFSIVKDLMSEFQYWSKVIGFEYHIVDNYQGAYPKGVNRDLAGLVVQALSHFMPGQNFSRLLPNHIPYRSQKIAPGPVIIDTAHNVWAVKILVEQLKLDYQIKRWNFFFNLRIDRDIKAFFEAIKSDSIHIYLCHHPECHTPKSIPKELYHIKWLSPDDAISILANQPAIICGSFHVLEACMPKALAD
tara:strand:+ start:5189 stop:6316 length:1128 start_codon:yes stop_codon:yes gene_type:complete